MVSEKPELAERSPIQVLTARGAAWLWWSPKPRIDRPATLFITYLVETEPWIFHSTAAAHCTMASVRVDKFPIQRGDLCHSTLYDHVYGTKKPYVTSRQCLIIFSPSNYTASSSLSTPVRAIYPSAATQTRKLNERPSRWDT